MSEKRSDFRRILESGGVYALAGAAQQALSFLLLPIYTRLIPTSEYGKLELLLAFASVFFGLLSLGLPSSIVKSLHRDSENDSERERVLATSMSLGVPALGIAALVSGFGAPWLSSVLLGDTESTGLVRLAVAYGFSTTALSFVTASFRARERAGLYAAVSLGQVSIALGLNLWFVVGLDLGVRGILLGNVISCAVMLPVALLWASRTEVFRIAPRLVGPMLRFGLLLVPTILAAWIMDSSDRYVLRLYDDLSNVAVYGVGYKFGVLIEIAIVWPFQLAWPAVAFGISQRAGHERTFARTLTMLSAVLMLACLVLSLATRLGLPILVGEGYELAYLVVPIAALAHSFRGVQFCVSPGLHLTGNTAYLTVMSLGAAALNLGLNFLLIPHFGMMGAAGATALSLGALAFGTAFFSNRFHPVPYEYGRLALLWGGGFAIGAAVLSLPIQPTLPWIAGLSLFAAVAMPVLLFAVVFAREDDRQELRDAVAQMQAGLRARKAAALSSDGD